MAASTPYCRMPASKSLNLVTGTLARLASQVHRLTWWLFSFMYSDWEQCCLLPARNIVCGHDHRVQYFLEFYSAKVISRPSPPPPPLFFWSQVLHHLRSIFGLFTVPPRVYPWALLLVFQLLMPGVSFLGHLSGILAGYACTCHQLSVIKPLW